MYVVSGFVDHDIFMWKCHLPIITDINLRHGQSIGRKSKSDYPKMFLLTIVYVHFSIHYRIIPFAVDARVLEYFCSAL